MYIISPTGGCDYVVFCDMCIDDGDGWIIIQRRENDELAFHMKNWEEYKMGFGDYGGNYWIGLEKIHELTSTGQHELYIAFSDGLFEEKYAVYEDFSVDGEGNGYKLSVSSISTSRSSDNLQDSLSDHNNQKFSTFDRDNDSLDTDNCAYHSSTYYGGWWFGQNSISNTGDCIDSNLNGHYFENSADHVNGDGIVWQGVGSTSTSMKYTIMAIRPV